MEVKVLRMGVKNDLSRNSCMKDYICTGYSLHMSQLVNNKTRAAYETCSRIPIRHGSFLVV